MIIAPRRAHLSFGTFEVDLDAGEIRKAGLRVKLPGQPFRVLAALLSRPGEVVTHEELQREIWGANTNVDFERGIAGAINKVREALGDSAENPRYIETLARRGYRFIAPVTVERLVEHTDEPGQQPVGVELLQPQAAQPPASRLTAEPVPFPVPAALSDGSPDGILAGRADGIAFRAAKSRAVAAIAFMVTGALLLVGLSSWATYHLTHTGQPFRPPMIRQLTAASEIYSGPPNPETLMTMVSDGPRLYTSVLADGRSEISSISLSGAQPQPVAMPDELSRATIADISPDGSKLLVRSQLSRGSEQPLWIVPTAGSSALRVGEVLAHDATWMPGGSGILFASEDELRVVRLENNAVTAFATVPGRAFWPRWSPDGQTLRFTLQDPVTHRSSLWELDARTRRAHALVYPELQGLSLCCGSWTADGKTFVFEASNAQESNIWALETGANGRLTELTNGPLRYMSPLPSRSDRMLYIIGLEQPAGTRLYQAKSHQFVPAPSCLTDARRVSYSRDGHWVAWVDNDGRLWRARTSDGSSRLQLTEDNLEVFLAQWSPDGQQLVMMARQPGETWQIYTVSAKGGAPRCLLAEGRNLADPDWSPDGTQIVFGREADLMGKENGPHTIQILNLANHQTRVLPGSQDLFSPRWSPDGRWIVALSLDQTELLLYDVQRNAWRTLFTGGAADPVWGSDSKALYFHAFAKANSAIVRLTLDGVAQPVADLSNLGMPSTNNYVFSGVTPDGSPIIQPRIGTGNLYSVALPKLP